MRKLTCFIFVLFLLTSCNQGNPTEKTIMPEVTEKNKVTEIFFADESFRLEPENADIVPTMIHKMNLESGEISIINKVPAHSINVKDDWIYFVNRREGKIYRTSKDGKFFEKVSEEPVVSCKDRKTMIISEGSIYYLYGKLRADEYYSNEPFHLKRMNLDGSNPEFVLPQKVYSFGIWNNEIYYTTYEGHASYSGPYVIQKLYRIVEGELEDEFILHGAIIKYVVKDNYIYCLKRYLEGPSNTLFRIDLSDLSQSFITRNICDFDLCDDGIVVINETGIKMLNTEGDFLYDIYESQKDLEDIYENQDNIKAIKVLEDVILFHPYYKNNCQQYYCCCIRLDGTQFRVLDCILDAKNDVEREMYYNIYEDRENRYRFSYPSNWELSDQHVVGNPGWFLESSFEGIGGSVFRYEYYKSKQQVIDEYYENDAIIKMCEVKTNDDLDGLMILSNSDDGDEIYISYVLFADDNTYGIFLYMSHEVYAKYEYIIHDMFKRFKIL